MPWAKIPPDRLADLPLFGIDLVSDDGDWAWYRGPSGRMRIEKAKPKVWFEDVGDAHQCGALGILVEDLDGQS